MPKLTFKNEKFVISGTDARDTVMLSEWEKSLQRQDQYTTTDVKAAARFRFVADERAERIFERALVKRYETPSTPLPRFLDPHQADGVRWILTRSRSYLAHAPGAGKTAEAIIGAMLTKGIGKAVFIVPPSLTANWAREIGKFWELAHHDEHSKRYLPAWPAIAVIPDSSRQDFTGWNADYIIVPDSMLTKLWVYSRLGQLDIKFIAVDEASRFKESTAQRTIALFGGVLKDGRKAEGLIQKARHAVLLDGSPMPNRPMELWAPTYAMAPECIDFMSQSDFGFRYCGATLNKFGQWEYKHSSREGELKQRLQKDFMHVVTEDRLGHSERKRSLLFMNDDVRGAVQKKWELANLSKINFDELDEETSQGKLASFRAELGLKKVEWVADYTRMRLEQGENVLLFVWHREVAFKLMDALCSFGPCLVIGGTDSEERERAFEEFQAGRRKLIIGNIAAMGRGHNLQRADRIIFGEFSWTDETNLQCEKRASRKGRDAELPVKCDYIVCPNSMDEPVLNAVFKKAARVKKVIG